MTAPQRAPLGWADVATLFVVVLAGLVNLPVPFDTDQGFFTTGARQLLAGDVLYRDFWDLKQPGIFWFYLAAGRTAGFHEIGIHAVELGYMGVLAAVLLVTLRGPAGSPRIARLALLLTVGVYYAVVSANQLTQVEGLAGLPIFLCLWWALRSTERAGGAAGWLFLSGMAGGAVLAFKLVLLPILLGIWLVALLATGWPGPRPTLARLARWSGAVGLGLAVPLGAVAVALSAQGVLADALQTFFVYPARIAAGTRGVGVPGFVAAGLLWFGEHFGPVLALALVGAWAGLSTATEPATGRARLLVRALVTWVVSGALVIVLQRKWWPYQYLLLFVPLGILAAIGIDAVRRRAMAGTQTGARRIAGLALALVFLGFATALVQKAILFRHGLPSATQELRLLYAERFNPKYPTVFLATAFLRDPSSLPGAIYVIGDPFYYYLAGRPQAVPIPGAWFENYDPGTWDVISGHLARRLPPYVFVAYDFRAAVAQSAPQILRLLEERYHLLRESPKGTWYVRAAGRAAPVGGAP